MWTGEIYMAIELGYSGKIVGELNIPGDKSISHRSIIFSSLSTGTSRIQGFLESNDCLNTINAFRKMGVSINKEASGDYIIHGVGMNGLNEPDNIIECGNSGTTMRLLTGLLAGQPFYSVLNGDRSLNNRPMKRIIDPLSQMGAYIWSRRGKLAPLSIKGTNLQGINYKMPIASAQLKSSILLAGLYTNEEIILTEPTISRDHTEKFFNYMGLKLIKQDKKIFFPSSEKKVLQNKNIKIPGDISTAAYFIAAALIIENSQLVLQNVGINHTRSGFLDIIKEMGGDFKLVNKRKYGLEPVADIKVNNSKLKGVKIEGDIIPRLIDELPLITVLASHAEGKTIIRDAAELRVKETDRIKAMVNQLSKLGVDIKELPDGMIINGPTTLNNNLDLYSYGDHRVAMSLAVACLKVDGSNIIRDTKCIDNSFPGFETKLKSVLK